MNENKVHQIKVRVTSQDKERISNYCAANNLTISQFLRMAIAEIINKGE